MSNGMSRSQGMGCLSGMNLIDMVRVTNVPCILVRNGQTAVNRLYEPGVRAV